MSLLIAKNAGTPFEESATWRELMYKSPIYLGFAYAKDGQIHVEKYIENYGHDSTKRGNIDVGFERMEALTDFDLIAFFDHKRNKAFEKNHNNIPPIAVNDKLAFVSAGEILDLSKKTAQTYSDSFYMNYSLFEAVSQKMPDAFFNFSGIWLLEKFIPYYSGMAFLKGDGNISLINQSRGVLFNNLWCFDSNFKPQSKSFFARV